MLSVEVGLVLFVAVIPVRVASIAIAMMVVLFFYKVLKKAEFAAFGYIEWLQPDIFVKHFEAPLFVHLLFGRSVVSNWTVLFVNSIFEPHHPANVMLTPNGSTYPVPQNSDRSFGNEFQDVP